MGPEPRDLCVHSWGNFRCRGKDLRRASIPDSSAGELLPSLAATGGAIFDQDSLNPTNFLTGRKSYREAALCLERRSPTVSLEGAQVPTPRPAAHLARGDRPSDPEKM